MAMLTAQWQERLWGRGRAFRGSDGLTEAERAKFAAEWRAGSGARSTKEEMDRLEARARARRSRQNVG